MIHFISITSFRKRLYALLKIKRAVYSGITSEICNAFINAPIEQIRSNRDMILMDNESIVIKLRLPDKKQRLAKSNGYRLIYMVMKLVEVVVFLDIYPKRGPLQQLDIDDNELNRLLREFVTEFNNNTVVFHDIANDMREIPQ